MIKRTAEEVIRYCATVFPAVCITGPRQSGKTTLAKELFPHLPYLSFEDPDTFEAAQKDTRNFLEQYRASGAIFDEIQNIPILFSYLQGIIDDNRTIMGRFIITGSQHFALSENITQSLAGRVGMITLLPLSLAELTPPNSAEEALFNGGYPGIHSTKIAHALFFESYIYTYIERDFKRLEHAEELAVFRFFIKLCAMRIGQPLVTEDIAKLLEMSNETIQNWFRILEASYITFTLSPYHHNFGKQLVKEPKLYFYDTGLACSLLNIENAEQLATHSMRGHLFENLIALELSKGRYNKGVRPNLSYWRDTEQNEVDIIAEWGGNIKSIEVKGAQTFNSRLLKNSRFLEKLSDDHIFKSYIIYTGAHTETHQGIKLIPYTDLATLLDE